MDAGDFVEPCLVDAKDGLGRPSHHESGRGEVARAVSALRVASRLTANQANLDLPARIPSDTMPVEEVVMIVLTEEQRQELSRPEPFAVDPLTREEYALVPRSLFQTFKGLIEDDPKSMYPMLAEIDPDDWEDAANYDVTT